MDATRLGPYELFERERERGFWVVYNARHTTLGRAARVKTTKPAFVANEEQRDDLLHEAESLAKLSHPAFVTVLEIDGALPQPFFAYEKAEGLRLSALVAKTKVDPAAACAIALVVADALAHAHARGVIFGGLGGDDINVSALGTVKLEPPLAPRGAHAAHNDAFEAGEVFAHPETLSPEQARGEPATVVSDIFALGVVLHTLLARRHPFAASEPRATLRRLRHEKPEPLPAATPSALAAIVAHCLERSPEARPRSATAVAETLEAALASLSREPVPVLVARAFAAAHVGSATPLRGGSPAAPAPKKPRFRQVLLRNGVVGLAVALAFIGATQLFGDDAPVSAPDVVPGHVRVLASPWADVLIDGKRFDTTPVGRPIPLSPGKHRVTFRHPSAPDEERDVLIVSGQSLLLDVTMRIERAAPALPSATAPRQEDSP